MFELYLKRTDMSYDYLWKCFSFLWGFCLSLFNLPRLFLWNTIPGMKIQLKLWWQKLMLWSISLVRLLEFLVRGPQRYLFNYCGNFNSMVPGREYETRNYSFEEVNHHMAEQLAMVGSVAILLYSVLRLVEYHWSKLHVNFENTVRCIFWVTCFCFLISKMLSNASTWVLILEDNLKLNHQVITTCSFGFWEWYHHLLFTDPVVLNTVVYLNLNFGIIWTHLFFFCCSMFLFSPFVCHCSI